MLPQEIRFINDFNVLDLSNTGDKAQTLNCINYFQGSFPGANPRPGQEAGIEAWRNGHFS
jgi:hypothetical protein